MTYRNSSDPPGVSSRHRKPADQSAAERRQGRVRTESSLSQSGSREKQNPEAVGKSTHTVRKNSSAAGKNTHAVKKNFSAAEMSTQTVEKGASAAEIISSAVIKSTSPDGKNTQTVKKNVSAAEKNTQTVKKSKSAAGRSTPPSGKKKRPLTPEEKRRRAAKRALRQASEEESRMKALKEEAEERDRQRRERQKKAAERRRKQMIIHTVMAAAAVIAVIMGIVLGVKAFQKKRLEPENGAGAAILQAAEEAVENNNSGNAGSEGVNTGTDGQTGNAAGSESQNSDAQNPGSNTGTAAAANAVQPADNRLTLCMVGDVILHQKVLNASASDGGYNFDNLFANVTSEVQKYDIRIANQETIMGGPALEYTGYPAFNSPYEEADALVNAGFNVILQATNHTLDKGKSAVQNCLNYWNTTHPDTAVLGIHDDNEPSQDIYVYEKNGIRVAILNYTYGTNQYAEEVASGELAGEVNFLEMDRVQQDVQRAREMADYVLVCPHWGVENDMEPSSDQEYWNQYFLSWGVDLVLGTHPHVIQPIRTLTRDDGHQMLVYYSLGNFLSNQEDRFGNVGGMAQVVIEKKEDGSVVTADYGVRTLVCHESFDGEAYTTYFLDDYTESLAEVNDVKASDPEFSYSYCQELKDQVFGDVKSISIE